MQYFKEGNVGSHEKLGARIERLQRKRYIRIQVSRMAKLTALPAYKSILPHMKNLNHTGYFAIDERYNSRTVVILHRIYRIVITLCLLIHIGLEMAYTVVNRNDLGKVVDCLFMMVTRIDTFVKFVVFRLQHDRIQALLDLMNGPHFNYEEKLYQSMLLETAATAKMILRAYTSCALVTCFLWAVFPFVDRYMGKVVEMTVWIPEGFIERPGMLLLVVLLTEGSTTIIAYSNTTMDAAIGSFLAQAKIQLRILRHRLEHIVDTAHIEAKEKGLIMLDSNFEGTHDEFQKVLMEKFIECLEQYKLITEFVDEVQKLFSGATFFQFNVSCWIICMTAYKLTSLDAMSLEFASIILYMICMLVELLVYCYYGNELLYESEQLIQAAYDCDWLQGNAKFHRALLIFMERTKKPIVPMCGGIIHLSLDTFVKILKMSYSLYAVLHSTRS